MSTGAVSGSEDDRRSLTGLANGIEKSLAAFSHVTLSNLDWQDVVSALRRADRAPAQGEPVAWRSAMVGSATSVWNYYPHEPNSGGGIYVVEPLYNRPQSPAESELEKARDWIRKQADDIATLGSMVGKAETERDAARAHVERLTAALEIVANHPEKSEPGANPSYSMGWVFYRIRDVARAALAAERSRPAAHTQRDRLSGSGAGMIDNITEAQFNADRSDEKAIVGKSRSPLSQE